MFDGVEEGDLQLLDGWISPFPSQPGSTLGLWFAVHEFAIAWPPKWQM